MTFRLKITLGNDAMQTGLDIAVALREVADTVEARLECVPMKRGCSGIARDLNGNTVGQWEVK